MDGGRRASAVANAAFDVHLRQSDMPLRGDVRIRRFLWQRPPSCLRWEAASNGRWHNSCDIVACGGGMASPDEHSVRASGEAEGRDAKNGQNTGFLTSPHLRRLTAQGGRGPQPSPPQGCVGVKVRSALQTTLRRTVLAPTAPAAGRNDA
mmetsp:Transcript_109246/g.315687  ORF Transcript_109246/g.315687 Transcript_109246/m.315687 type:complete len:150 (+) Transcript_109246:387-836(+)